MNYKVISSIFHEPEPKKMGIWQQFQKMVLFIMLYAMTCCFRDIKV